MLVRTSRHVFVVLVAILMATSTAWVSGCAADSPAGDGHTPADVEGALAVSSVEMSSGPRSGYQNVTIRGTGFGKATGVSFGSTRAVGFTLADPTRIVAVTPVGELGLVVDITVASDTEVATLPAAYTYWDYDLELTKGAQTVTCTLDKIKSMEPVTGYWGAVNDRPYSTARYKGVPLLTLLEAVGGWAPGETITVTAADGFTTTYAPEVLRQMDDGTYPMWNVNGAEVITDDRVAELLLAYEIAGEPLKAGKGPFRIVAMTTQDDRLSQGPWNPALVVSVTVGGR
ncbi:MAG: IPT/TIG domain-containing protein [Thermoleophilia bacterium]|nr:IPT/TIG domain-containing protein [Thermoleophilia bacterium]